MVVQRLTLRDVQQVCESLPARSVNLGVGVNGLHAEYEAILDYLCTRALKTSITSNGLSLQALDDAALKRFHSVEVSLDFPTERDHDAFRGAGNWRTVMGALGRCVELGVPVTVTSVMMSVNYDRLADLARLAAGFGAHLRVNIYQPAKTDRFTLTYEQFWRGVRLLSAATRLVATTEPVLAAVLGAPDFTGPGCGRSTVRVAPDGRVLPCTYWPASRLTLTDLARLGGAIVATPEFVEARPVPAARPDCPCRAGFAGRRALAGRPGAPHPDCPFPPRQRDTPHLEPAERQGTPEKGS